jgi:hypothetical protein
VGAVAGVVGVRKRRGNEAAALDALKDQVDVAKRSVVRLTAEAEKAAERKLELPKIDAAVRLAEIPADEGERQRQEILTADKDARVAVEREELVVVELESRLAAAGHALADEILAGPGAAVREEEAALAQIDAARIKQAAKLDSARAREAEAVERADAVRAEHDPAEASRQADKQRKREEMILWAIRNGTADAMEMLPAELRPEVEARRAQLAAEQDARREAMRAERPRDAGEILPHEGYPVAQVR